jgi:hypothetical protein
MIVLHDKTSIITKARSLPTTTLLLSQATSKVSKEQQSLAPAT